MGAPQVHQLSKRHNDDDRGGHVVLGFSTIYDVLKRSDLRRLKDVFKTTSL